MSEPLLGILQLETRFPRIPGDVANPATWPFPVAIEMVPGAAVERVTRGDDLLAPFVAAGERLAARGVRGLTTSCGFLAPYQRALTARLSLPVLASSLQQIPLVQATLPAGRRVGVITFDAGRLGPGHLEAAGAAVDTPVVGVEGGRELHPVIAEDRPRLDPALAEGDVLAAGDALRAAAPELGAVVLECANMAPYARALSRRLALPVYDIVALVSWFCAGLAPAGWPQGAPLPRELKGWPGVGIPE